MTQLRQNPLDFSALDALRQHCEATREYGVWAEALEHHARAASAADGDPSELGRLHFELGNLYRDQLAQPELALEHYRTAFDFDAAQRPAIVAARAIVTELGDFAQAAELLAHEAESLPAGAKRAAALAELAALYKQLQDRDRAEGALRDAVADAPQDLQVQHELATLLLEQADQLAADEAAEKRGDAADVLTDMALSVSDDYALAYVEAALDAVPDHRASLALLEQVAPRLKRGDVLAPRWLAAIRITQDRALARKLRLDMARAYVAVGQLDDARICLNPLLAEGDAEAKEIERELESARGTKTPTLDARAREDSIEHALSSAELVLEDEEPERDSLADQLGELGDAAAQAEANAPLADLATLEHHATDTDDARDLSALLDSTEQHVNEPNHGAPAHSADALTRDEGASSESERTRDEGAFGESERASEDEGAREAISASEDESAREAISASEDESAREAAASESGEKATSERTSERAPSTLEAAAANAPPSATDTPVAASPSEPAPEAPRRSKRPSLGLPFDDNDVDPFAEETQPRTSPLTLAELTALTGGSDVGASRLPDLDEEEQDVESEVTQITPAEDPQLAEVRSLRTELARRLRFRDRRGAAEVGEALIERGVFDAEAIEALEEHYRLTRDFRRLRDLCLRIARELSFSVDVRAARLREAVTLSESKLGDQDGAATALSALLELDPSDGDAFDKFKRVLQRSQRWDELAELLETRAGADGAPHVRAELLRELFALERDKRGAPERAIDALERARALAPRPEDDVALSELYWSAGRHAEAATALEARLVHAERSERSTLLARLAKLYEEQLRDDAGALRAFESLRELEPRKLEPLDGVIRVHERRRDAQALVGALSDKLALSPVSERGKLHVRIAELALHELHDAERAADAYAEAIALLPGERALWSAAAPAFERAGRAPELDALLTSLAQGTRDRALSSRIWGHLAETRAAQGDPQGAIAAREAQLGASSDVAVLEALVELLRRAERPSDLARRLDELARRSEPDAARTLRLERASVLAEKLHDAEGAKAELERVLSELAPDDAHALRMLIDLCIATGDTSRRASAQERLIKLAPSLSARIELATELIELYERELHDNVGAIRVLSLWTTLEPQNPQPYLRLVPLLTQAGKRRELVEANDKLAALAMTDEEAGEFVLRAARVAIELEDYDGAWNRLVPRVVDHGDLAAETLLRELATIAHRGEQLAALYVGLAQRAETPERERQCWTDAARAFEQQVGAPDRALEAMLRALAKQLDSEELLGEVERLAERARAWPRLAQVYDTLIRKADSTSARIALLLRHARLLETRAEDTAAAFERVWLAFQLDPSRDDTYEETKRLALASDRREELLSAHERRAQSNADLDARLAALLEACALAQHRFEDTARATGYLSRAVALAGDAAARLDAIETRVGAIDAELPPVHGRGLLAELAGVYASLAAETPKKPELASTWLARAARIQEHTLDDPAAAYRVLERASALAPSDHALLDELQRVAAIAGKWEALANHLQHTADVAIDSRSSSAALSRLGALYERELASPTRAADAYEQLVRLRPQDAEASRRLRTCLRAAERFEELLIAIDRELFMIKPEQGKLELLKQAAETWEHGLKNKYEALDAWRKVVLLEPQDSDALAALVRLRSRPRADDSLLDGDLVVLPEDLRPSLTGTPVSEAAFTASAREPVAFFGEPHVNGTAVEGERVEPEQVSSEELSLLSSELALVSGSVSVTVSEERAPERAAYDDDFDEVTEPKQRAEVVFDADVTIPLERELEEEVAVISLEGLSSLVERQADRSAQSAAPPKSPKRKK